MIFNLHSSSIHVLLYVVIAFDARIYVQNAVQVLAISRVKERSSCTNRFEILTDISPESIKRDQIVRETASGFFFLNFFLFLTIFRRAETYEHANRVAVHEPRLKNTPGVCNIATANTSLRRIVCDECFAGGRFNNDENDKQQT